jgi:hypothetical protein
LEWFFLSEELGREPPIFRIAEMVSKQTLTPLETSAQKPIDANRPGLAYPANRSSTGNITDVGDVEEVISEPSSNPLSLWLELHFVLVDCYQRNPPNDDLIGRIYDFVLVFSAANAPTTQRPISPSVASERAG